MRCTPHEFNRRTYPVNALLKVITVGNQYFIIDLSLELAGYSNPIQRNIKGLFDFCEFLVILVDHWR